MVAHRGFKLSGVVAEQLRAVVNYAIAVPVQGGDGGGGVTKARMERTRPQRRPVALKQWRLE